MSVNVRLGDEQGLDRALRYLRPVGRLQLPGEPDLVHLSVYEWLPSFEAWATGPGLCGRSTSQGPLPEGTVVTCPGCERYRPEYEAAFARQASVSGEGGHGVREVRIVVHAPTDENAGHWAQTIRDLVVAEYGQEMRLEVTIGPGVER